MRSVLSIGNFDGLHLGHRKLLGILVELSVRKDLRSVVISYDNHPSQVLNPRIMPLVLTPGQAKRQAILEFGIDQVELLHFDSKLAATSAESFLDNYLMPAFSPGVIVVGYDSHFGKNRRGDFAFLQLNQDRYGYELVYVEPFLHEDRVVSSSLIRELLLMGDVSEANQLLGKPYTLYGSVVSGAGLGTGLGFPTANLALGDPLQLVPKTGLYLSRVNLDEGSFFGLTNIGTSPTMKQSAKVEIETYIIDCDRMLYGRNLSIDLLRFLREERLFESREALIEAMNEDLAVAMSFSDKDLF